MPHLHDLITTKAQELFPVLQRLRRDFHRHPELSNQEERTGRLAAEYLTGLGLTVQTDVAGHGVVADLVCSRPGPTLAWRADMDALPIQEPFGQTLVLSKSRESCTPAATIFTWPSPWAPPNYLPSSGRPWPAVSVLFSNPRKKVCRPARWAAPNLWSSLAFWMR